MEDFFQFKLPDAELKRLHALLPYDTRSAAARTGLALILDFVEKGGAQALGLVLKGEVCLAAAEPPECSDYEQKRKRA